MVPLVNNSIASLQPEEFLLIQERLLQHGISTKDTKTRYWHPEATSQPANFNDDQDVELADSTITTNVQHSKRTRRPPRLNAVKTAPAASIAAMVDDRPSQQARLLMSFQGYPGGDTQPMESQVYRDFPIPIPGRRTTDLSKQSEEQEHTPTKDGADESAFSARSLHVDNEGHESYIDLANAWPEQLSPSARTTTSEMDDLLASPETQLRTVEAQRSRRFPETPALAGSKRANTGEMLTSALRSSKTPRFSQAFGTSKVPDFSATQLFNQTQAPSSPVPDVPRSDPVLTRPSPNIYNEPGPSPSNFNHSSPLLSKKRIRHATPGEPRDTYTSMRESQERRAQILRGQQEDRNGEEAEGLEDSEWPLHGYDRFRSALNDRNFEHWKTIQAPARPNSRPSSSRKRTSSADHSKLIQRPTERSTSPARSLHQDIDDDDGFPADESEPEGSVQHHNEDEERDADTEDDDQYDELGQIILRSQANVDEDEDDDSRNGQNANGEDHETKSNPDQADQEDDVIGDVIRHPEHSSNHRYGTQHTAIADSQSEHHSGKRSLLSGHVVQPSSLTSVVPGSQYAGLTSQELARQNARNIPSSTVPHHAPLSSVKEDITHDVPSSPPLLGAHNTTYEDNVIASPLHRSPFLPSQHQVTVSHPETQVRTEVPDSDMLEKDVGVDEPLGGTPQRLLAVESVSDRAYATAPTHLSVSPSKTRVGSLAAKDSASQQSVPSPLKAAGVRRYADIAAEPSQSNVSHGESVDYEAIVDGVITGDDQQYLDVMSSPRIERARKRKGPVQNPSESIETRQQASVNIPRYHGHDRSGSAVASQPPQNSSGGSQSEVMGKRRKTTSSGDDSLHPDLTDKGGPKMQTLPVQEILESPEDVRRRKRSNQASQRPERRARTLSPSNPAVIDNDSKTPDSVGKRERAGAQAASQLIAARSTEQLRPAKLSGTGRKTSSIHEQLSASAPGLSSPASQAMTKDAALTDECNTSGIEMPIPENPIHNESSSEASGEAGVDAPEITNPERIFALFKGTYNAHYPATHLSTSTDGQQCRVRFDDDTVVNVKIHDVLPLDLHVGDIVKVDIREMRKRSWIVKGFGSLSTKDAQATQTDIYGHTRIQLQAKATQRKSLVLDPVGEGELVEVEVTYTYLTSGMLPHFRHRPTLLARHAKLIPERTGTPLSEAAKSTDVDTPTSRSSRQTHETRLVNDGFVGALGQSFRSAMFEGMAFAISYASKESEKAHLTSLIRRNGGIILEQGFDELFVPPQVDGPVVSSAELPQDCDDADTRLGGLKLKPAYEALGFVALIADGHSRRTKYMQALALGLPTLSGRWILDSMDADHNSTLASDTSRRPLPWTKYLLAAGESKYLGGAVRSRNLSFFDPTTAHFNKNLADREMLLHDDNVLIVAPKKGKSNTSWERRKLYAFLTLAMGANSVKRIADLQEARALIEIDNKWTWVYVNGNLYDAAAALFPRHGRGAGSKKGKLMADSVGNKKDSLVVKSPDNGLRVVGDEYVVQSLILGALVE